MLKKLLPPTGVAAEFEDETLKIGTVKLKDRTLVCVFNWGSEAAKVPVRLARAGDVTDLWSGATIRSTSAPSASIWREPDSSCSSK